MLKDLISPMWILQLTLLLWGVMMTWPSAVSAPPIIQSHDSRLVATNCWSNGCLLVSPDWPSPKKAVPETYAAATSAASGTCVAATATTVATTATA